MSGWRAKDTCQSVGHTVGTKDGFNKRKKKLNKEKKWNKIYALIIWWLKEVLNKQKNLIVFTYKRVAFPTLLIISVSIFKILFGS